MKEDTKTDWLKDLLVVQSLIEGVTKSGVNPFFHSDYATLNDVVDSCKKILNDNNFIVLQPIVSDVEGVYVCTTLLHTSGNKIESKMRIQAKSDNNPQDQGSAISYARRYSLQSLLCMSAVDDDGEKATNHSKEVTKEQDKKTRACIHEDCSGVQTYKEGISKSGKNYKGWFCDVDNTHLDWVK